MSRRRRRGGSRKHRARPVPKWLSKGGDLDRVAQERCLLVLSVLSGEKPVTDAVEEARISRGTYYQLETKALSAMLRALEPGSSSESDPASPKRRITALEAKVKELTRARRRTERLLLMTRRVMKVGEGRIVSTRSGSSRSRSSRKKRGLATAPSMPPETGEDAP